MDSRRALLVWHARKIVPGYAFPAEDVDADRGRARVRRRRTSPATCRSTGTAADRWLEEDEEVVGHPRDPFHRVDVRESTRHVVVARRGRGAGREPPRDAPVRDLPAGAQLLPARGRADGPARARATSARRAPTRGTPRIFSAADAPTSHGPTPSPCPTPSRSATWSHSSTSAPTSRSTASSRNGRGRRGRERSPARARPRRRRGPLDQGRAEALPRRARRRVPDGRRRRDTWRWVQFKFPNGGKVELLEPLGEGFLSRFLEKHGEGLHHITFKTDDIEAAIEHVRGPRLRARRRHLEGEHWKEAFLRPSERTARWSRSRWSSHPDDVAEHHLRPSNLEELLSA